MPGLFGFVAVKDPMQIEREFAESLFSKMEKNLSHSAQQIDRWNDSSGGAYIGRVGPPLFNSVPWVQSAEADGKRSHAFIAGSVHSDRSGNQDCARGFLDNGMQTISELRGFYLAAIRSTKPDTTVIATDRRSSIPLYYAEWGGLLLFAPELKALLAVPKLSRELDWQAVAMYLGSGHLLAHQSLISSVRRLPGGEALVVERGRVERREYWRFRPGSNLDGTRPEELEDELGVLVSTAVGRNLGDPGRTVIFLSGGTDSRSILAGALDAVNGRGRRLSTVCWRSRQGTDVSDAGITKRIASEFHLDHRFVRRSIDNYARDFSATNYLLDGQSDMAALHPYEHHLAVDLRDAGFQRALRGDQVFTSGGARHIIAHNMSAALADAGLRRIRDLAPTSIYVRPLTHKLLSEASDAAIDSVLDSVRNLEPNDAKHYLYFAHRVQGYLNSGAYMKQVVLDTRNVLLDEDILTFQERVPAGLRHEKTLFRRAMRRRYPELWAIPMATEHDLEDWDWQLGNDTHIRRFVTEQLEDEQSGIWQYFDSIGLRALLDSLVVSIPPTANSERRFGRAFVKKVLSSVSPRLVSARMTRTEAGFHPANRALLRVMSLKDWYDKNVG